ncbi:thioredoxin fold domain-containing protein [Dyadobacter sp. CY345]|uniref:TlpA family protein disulfide reductase n=1 Tax=Dyadobacter sp. CY345 TaxID=2909335 RepID=UPI001F476309|nr:thioredoxin fold domain-containing protein [Dyadobacter sp. CY345]MCF2443759.1 thioredoxin fold domain-containing protein [Dyadobacter sp. CY345]
MSKKIIPLFLFILLSVSAFSQTGVGTKKIAPFQMTLTNGKPYNFAQLMPGPVVLMYFSPDCEHCQDFTKALLKNYTVISNKQLVMITFQSMEMIKKFEKDYNLAAYPNIKIGTEGTSYLVQKYYQIRSFPYIAMYDKSGKHVRTFEGEQPYTEIFKALKSF